MRAIRALLRSQHARVEEAGTRLSTDDAARLWHTLTAHGTTPLDSFDDYARRYLLLRTGDARTSSTLRSLTAREREVLEQLATGDSDKAIAFHAWSILRTIADSLPSFGNRIGSGSIVSG